MKKLNFFSIFLPTQFYTMFLFYFITFIIHPLFPFEIELFLFINCYDIEIVNRLNCQVTI